MIHEALLAGAVGSLLWLDRFQVFQFLVSRPIVAAPLVGWAAGDVSCGLASGILFELLWLKRLPVGGHIAPDACMASMVLAGASAVVRSQTGADLAALLFAGFLLVFPVAFVGKNLDVLLRTGLGRISSTAQQRQAFGTDTRIVPYLGIALLLGFALAFLVLFPAILCGAAVLGKLWPLIPSSVNRAFRTGFYVVPLLGIADLMMTFQAREYVLIFALGFAVALGGGVLLAHFG
jgi:mannose PTS system EIIC component